MSGIFRKINSSFSVQVFFIVESNYVLFNIYHFFFYFQPWSPENIINITNYLMDSFLIFI